MPRQIIKTANAPASPLYSQAVRAGNMIHVSGTVGADPATGRMAGPTIEAQTLQALRNCEAILEAAGATRADIVEVHALLARPGDFDGFNKAYASVFTDDPPARSVGRLGPELENVLISIKMVACLDA